MALETVGEITAYLGDFEQVLAVGNEAAQVADDAGHEMLSAGMKNYQAIAHLQMGDAETAIRLLLEGDEVLSHLGELVLRLLAEIVVYRVVCQNVLLGIVYRVHDPAQPALALS